MDGVLVVNKPQVYTSHDIVALVRKRYGLRKVGHAGTLDPMATGVLVVLIGKCTKSSKYFLSEDKEYEGVLTLGATSDTGDAWGRVEPSGKEVAFEKRDIEAVFNRFTGPIEQVPPMYSAVKVRGDKLYELARKGIEINLKPRSVFIKELEITKVSLPDIHFKVTCSKGTYVRQLCADIGKELGCGGYLSHLKRTRSGRFTINQAVTLEDLKSFSIAELDKRLVGDI